MANENGSKIKDFFSGLGEQLIKPVSSYVWDYFGTTKSGAKIEANISGGVVSSYLNNPIVIIGLVIVGILILSKAFRKR